MNAASATRPEVELTPSPSAWLDVVLDNFDDFLRDHASCEKKASGMAMSVASHYPDQPELLTAMVDLAVEELNHYREVVRLMLSRGIFPGPDAKDPYVNALNQHIRRGPENFLLDRLVTGAVIERRGAERFSLIAEAVAAEDLRKFYRGIATSEDRHWLLFLDLAHQYCPTDQVQQRFAQLSKIEGQIMLQLPITANLH